MHITNDDMNNFKGNMKVIYSKILPVVFALIVYFIIYFIQAKSTLEDYQQSYSWLQGLMGAFSIKAYRGITAVVFTLVLYINLYIGVLINRGIIIDKSKAQITFEKDLNSKIDIIRMLNRVIDILNIVSAILIGYSYGYGRTGSFFIFSFLLFWMLRFFCTWGNVKEIFLYNPIISLITYGIYILYLTWFVSLITPSVTEMIIMVMGIGIIICLVFGMLWNEAFTIRVD